MFVLPDRDYKDSRPESRELFQSYHSQVAVIFIFPVPISPNWHIISFAYSLHDVFNETHVSRSDQIIMRISVPVDMVAHKS